jgi:hypothetical protein
MQHRQKRNGVCKTRMVRWLMVLIVLIIMFFGAICLMYWSDFSFYMLNGSIEGGDDFWKTNALSSNKDQQTDIKILAVEEAQGLHDVHEVIGATLSDAKPNLRKSLPPPPFPDTLNLRQPQKLVGASMGSIDPTKPYFVKFRITLQGNSSEPSNNVNLVFEILPEWAPVGTARFLELVQAKFYDNSRFFRVIKVRYHSIILLTLTLIT